MTASQQSNGRVIVVLGMHRSGTSVLTHCIHLLGANIASQVIAPQAAVNRDGFFEDAKLVALNEQLLSMLGSCWYDFRDLVIDDANADALQSWRNEALAHLRTEYVGNSLTVIKDPRMSRLMALWAPIFEDANLGVELVHILRQPEKVAVSLQRRNGMPPAYGLLLWCAHILDILKSTESNNLKATVLYDALVENSHKDVQLLANMLATEAANKSDYADVEAVIGKPLSASSSSYSDAHALIPELREFALRLYQSLASHVIDGELTIISKVRDELASDYESLLSRYAVTFETLRVLTEELITVNGKLVEIGELHTNAQAVVKQRDGQLAAVNDELARAGAELEHAQAVVVERDSQVADLNEQIARYENVWFRRGWRQLRRPQR